MGGVVIVRAYSKIGSINARVGIAVKENIKALSSVYSKGVYK